MPPINNIVMNEEQVKLLEQLKARKAGMRASTGLVLDMNTLITTPQGQNHESSVVAQDGLLATVWEIGKASEAYDKLEAMMDAHIEALSKGDASLQHQEWKGEFLKVQEEDEDEDGNVVVKDKYILGIGGNSRTGSGARRRRHLASLQG